MPAPHYVTNMGTGQPVTMATFVKFNPPNGESLAAPSLRKSNRPANAVTEDLQNTPTASPHRPASPLLAATTTQNIDTDDDIVRTGPQVTIVDGKIAVDASSLYVTRPTASTTPFERVEETGKRVTSASFRRAKRYNQDIDTSTLLKDGTRWSIKETFIFYECLAMLGTDFSMFPHFLHGRSREQIKKKFKREEKIDILRVSKALGTKKQLDVAYLKSLAPSVPCAVNGEGKKKREKTKK